LKQVSLEDYKTLNGTFWGLTTFFNPAGYENKYRNYRMFREASKKQGLNLVAVELAFGEAPFELTLSDAERLVQLRTSPQNILWQRERLLNIALKNLPDDCDKIAWIDCDLLFKNNNWIPETCQRLEVYRVLQPFDACVRLSKGLTDLSDDDCEQLRLGRSTGESRYGRGYAASLPHKTRLTGLAWCARRSIFEKQGFYDKFVLGGCDGVIARGFTGTLNDERWKRKFPAKMVTDQQEWATLIYQEVQGSISFVPGILLHLWHGERSNRFYSKRYRILQRHDFDPEQDIRLDDQGIWMWGSAKSGLHKDVESYFFFRREEGMRFRDVLHYSRSIRYLSHLLRKVENIKPR
jgi:hypothetical protein